MDKEHHNRDIVYFMYDNKPAKGVVIGECKQKLIQLDINNDEELVQCLNNDYIASEHTKTECNNFNRIVKIDSDDGYNKYTPIDGWFESDNLYNNVDDLFCSLLETKL